MSEKLSNLGPLGLMAFGMTTVLLNFHNAGLYGLGTMILAMGIFYGGLAQVIAGIMEFKRGNTFATTAFCSFGFFWLTLVFLLVLPELGWWSMKPSGGAFGAYLFMWGLFTVFMFVATLRLNRGLQTVFLSLVILFWLLAAHNFWEAGTSGTPIILRIARWEGIFCGASAIYVSIAEVLNGVYGKVLLPIGPSNP